MIGMSPYQVPKNLFVVNPKHEGFVTGEKRKVADAGFIGGCLLYGFLSIFLVIALGLGVTAVQELNIRAELDQSGVTTNAKVIGHRTSTSRDSKGRSSTSYYITYEFYAGPANSDFPTLYTREQQVSSGTHNNYSNGDTFEIRYLANNPNVSRMLSDNVSDPKFLLVFAVIFAAVPLAIFYAGIRTSGNNRRLVRDGQLITGHINEATLRKMKSGYQLIVQYSFLSPEGEELSKTERLVRNDLQDQVLPSQGTPVAVLYVSPKIYRVI